MIVVTMLIAFVVTLELTRRFCNPASRLHILDHPNERSLHTQPLPRSGGVAVLGGLVAGGIALSLYSNGGTLGVLLIDALPVALVSFLDDRFGISPAARIPAHLLAAAGLLGMGYAPGQLQLPGLDWTAPSWIITPVVLLFVVWMINLYNFMDGMDGFAGGMAVVGFVSFAMLGLQAGHPPFAGASLVVAGAAAGFLVFNFPPARIFLGDTGSSTLGFLVAAFSLWGSRDGLFPLWLAGLLFSPFIVDATVTLTRRLSRSEKVWLPHKTHYYQRLVQLGPGGHRNTLLAEYALMLACSLSVLLAVSLSPTAQIALALAWLLAYLLLMLGVRRLEERYSIRTSAS